MSCFLIIQNSRRWTKSRKAVIQIVTGVIRKLSQFIYAVSESYSQLGHDSFHLHAFQLIIHMLSFASTLYNLSNRNFIFGGCILLRSLLGLYYSGCQSQQSFFLLLPPSTHSLHVSAHAGHLQVNIFFEASYCLLTDPLFGLSLHILSLIINRYVLQVH
jgi:hypothetical protein